MNWKHAAACLAAAAGIATAGPCPESACEQEARDAACGERHAASHGAHAGHGGGPHVVEFHSVAFQPDGPLAEAMREGRPFISINESFTYVQQDGDRRVEVRVRGGNVDARINGEPVPESQIERREGAIVITPTDGEPIRIDTGGFGGPAMRGLRPGRAPGAGGAVAQLQSVREEPRTYLGIHMSEADPVVIEHLGLEDGGVIKIVRVMEGSPAAEAGVQPNDLLTGIDGSEGATPEIVREELSAKEPGEEVTLHLVRKGQPKELTVRLGERPQRPTERQGRGGPQAIISSPGGGFVLRPDDAEMDRLIDKLESLDLELELGAEGRTLRELLDSLTADAQIFGRFTDPEGRHRRFAIPPMELRELPRGGGGMVAPGRRGEALSGRLDELDRRLGDLERQLDRLTAAIERLDEQR